MDVPSPQQMTARIGALPAAAPLLAAIGDRAGIHLVGGAVRDLLLGSEPVDLDVVVEGDALGLARELGGEIRAHGRFGTVTVTLGGRSYDLAGARRERYACPGALPEVEPASLTEDLSRRDFTVNALAVALAGPHAGELAQAPGALHDLEAGRLRILHPISFIDDPTRLLRLVRYAARLSFAIDPGTDRLAREAVAAGALRTVSGPRIGTELRLGAREPDPVAAIGGLARFDLDHAIDPRLRLGDPSRARDALALLGSAGGADRLVIAAAAGALAADELSGLLDRLGWRAADRDVIVTAATRASELAVALAGARAPSQIAAAAHGMPPEAVALAGALGSGAARAAAREWLERLRHVSLAIGGADLLAAGVSPGPAVGRGLNAALAAKLDAGAADRDAELAIALAAARERR